MCHLQPNLCSLSKRLLSLRILLDDQRTVDVLTQPLPARRIQLGRKLQPAGPLDRLNRNLEVDQRLLVVDARVRQHKRSERHFPSDSAILSEDNLVEVCWNS